MENESEDFKKTMKRLQDGFEDKNASLLNAWRDEFSKEKNKKYLYATLFKEGHTLESANKLISGLRNTDAISE